MNPNREEALFALALEKPAEKRATFLDVMCEGDAALRARLEALLAAHEASGGVLGKEPVREVLAPTLDMPEPVADETVGMTLGRYMLRSPSSKTGGADKESPVLKTTQLVLFCSPRDTPNTTAHPSNTLETLCLLSGASCRD